MDPGGLQHPGRDVRQGGPDNQHQEDSRNSLLPMTGGKNAVGGGVRETDDGSGAFLPGETAVSGTVHGVRVRDGAWVVGGPSADAAWEGIGWETALGNHVLKWGATYLQDGLPNR